MSVRGLASAARRRIRAVVAPPAARTGRERDPDERPTLDSFDDWILFGPRLH